MGEIFIVSFGLNLSILELFVSCHSNCNVSLSQFRNFLGLFLVSLSPNNFMILDLQYSLSVQMFENCLLVNLSLLYLR